MFVPCKVCGFVIRCHSCNKLGEGGDTGQFISRIPFISAFISPIPIFSSSHVSHQNLKKKIYTFTFCSISFLNWPLAAYFSKIYHSRHISWKLCYKKLGTKYFGIAIKPLSHIPLFITWYSLFLFFSTPISHIPFPVSPHDFFEIWSIFKIQKAN